MVVEDLHSMVHGVGDENVAVDRVDGDVARPLELASVAAAFPHDEKQLLGARELRLAALEVQTAERRQRRLQTAIQDGRFVVVGLVVVLDL